MVYTTQAARKSFTTKDGAELSYLELGEGQPMVLVHGWSQSGLQWYNQIEEFSKTHRVLALDLRGHGESSKIDYGYRVYRLAKDVREFMIGLGLEPAIMMGHSLGCNILWAYWDLFGDAGIEKIVFVDSSPYSLDNPTQAGDSRIHAARGLTSDALFQMALSWANDDEPGTFARDFLRQQMTPEVPDEIFEKAFEQHMLLPKRHRADLFVNVAGLDERDVLSRISVPSLFVGGKISLVNPESVIWQAKQAQQGSYEIFVMFLENPAKFNQVVREFLG